MALVELAESVLFVSKWSSKHPGAEYLSWKPGKLIIYICHIKKAIELLLFTQSLIASKKKQNVMNMAKISSTDRVENLISLLHPKTA